MKTRTTTKKDLKAFGFFHAFASQFNQVAPLEWLPPTYRAKMRAAKPVRLNPPRVKKASSSLH